MLGNHRTIKEAFHIDIYDQHFVSAFDIKDKPIIKKKFMNRICSLNDIIHEIVWHRINLKKDYVNTGMKNKNIINAMKETDIELKLAREKQVNLMANFYSLIERFWNDQTVTEIPKPIENVFQNDVYVSEGIDIIGAQITSKTLVSWEWIQIGKGTRPAEIGDQGLQTPLGSFPIDEGGSFSSIGDQIRLFCVLPDSIESSFISEYAVTELNTGGKTLSRSTLKTPINHVIQKDFPTVTNVTYMIPHQDI
jgi:hypothetical protein